MFDKIVWISLWFWENIEIFGNFQNSVRCDKLIDIKW